MAALLWLGREGAGSLETGSGAREFGRLETLDADPLETNDASVQETSGPAAGSDEAGTTSIEESRRPPKPKPTNPERIYGRSAAEFRDYTLKSIGFSEEETVSVDSKFRAFLAAYDGPDGRRVMSNPRKASLEEREEFRKVRDSFMSPFEFDAFLFATGQNNRATLMRRPSPGGQGAEVGLQKGDHLISINELRIFDMSEFKDALSRTSEGELMDVVVHRAGTIYDLQLLCCKMRWGSISLSLQPPLDSERGEATELRTPEAHSSDRSSPRKSKMN